MKKSVITILLLILAIGTAPLISLSMGNGEYKNQAVKTSSTVVQPTQGTITATTESTQATTNKSESAVKDLSFKIFDKAENKVITVSDYDFCCGAIATEVESDIPFEYMKALAVAIHSYYSYLRYESRANSKEYDFECNSKVWSVYVSKDKLKEKLRDTFEKSYSTIEKAVSETVDTLILYDGKPCMARFFEISSGVTYSYNEIYGYDIPYLTSVPSPFDCVANNFNTKLSFSSEDFDKLIKSKFSDYVANENIENNIGEIILSENGALLNIEVGNKSIDGKDFADIIGLRSRCVEISINNRTYFFDVKGYGDNIGLSKYGAYKLAEQGNNFLEILSYYFPYANIAVVNS